MLAEAFIEHTGLAEVAVSTNGQPMDHNRASLETLWLKGCFMVTPLPVAIAEHDDETKMSVVVVFFDLDSFTILLGHLFRS